MNGCSECIAFKAYHNLIEPGKCENCGYNTLTWQEEDSGTFFVKCSHCSFTIGVDFNTPCECDPCFNDMFMLIIGPCSHKLSNQVVLDAAKFFHTSALQMTKNFREGFTVETSVFELMKMLSLLDEYNISYKCPGFIDPRDKYPHWKECRYPYRKIKA